MMRVLAIGNAYPPHSLGGYEAAWQGAMRHLRAEGHAVRILTTTPGRATSAARADERAAAEDPDVHRALHWYWRDHAWLDMGPVGRLRLERHNARVLDRHVDEFRPDVVTWWPMGGMSLSLIERARRAGLPSVLFVHDYWPTYGPERDLWTRAWARRPQLAPLAERVTGIPTRYELASAGRWVFNADCVRTQTAASGFDPPGSTVLAPGIDDAFLEAGATPASPEWRWQLLYVGRVVEQKGIHTAVEALADLPDPAVLQIVGDGEPFYRRRLESLAARLGLASRVRFEPSRFGPELIQTYRECDAVIFPVEWMEPWGLVPLEAMALGRPVVATGRGGSAEYLRDGQNALLFEAGESAALAAAVRRLADDPQLRDRLRAGGQTTAREHPARHFNRHALEQIASVVRA